MPTTRLDLPFSRPPLNLNDSPSVSRGARMARNNAIQNIRDTAYWIAHQHKLPRGLSHVTIQLHYQPKTKRNTDAINLCATQKALVDGLIGTPQKPGYGLAPGDDSRYVTDLMPVIHPAVKGQPGRLWLVLTWNTP